MKILITGARGFIGRNLVATLEAVRDGKDRTRGLASYLSSAGCGCGQSKESNLDLSGLGTAPESGDCGQREEPKLDLRRPNVDLELLPFDLDSDAATLDRSCQEADFVFHLAGVNRPKNPDEFREGNFGFTSQLLACLEKHGNRAPILISSSIQAEEDNPYGRSKKDGEDCLFAYGRRHEIPVCVYRLPNVYGKWARPNYNSAIATFCHNIARDLPIKVSDPQHQMRVVYIDDVIAEFIEALKGNARREGDFCRVEPEHRPTLGEIVELLQRFRRSRAELSLPDLGDAFTRRLYASYLSYLPGDAFSYLLNVNADARGSFTEFLRTEDRGQLSVNVSKAGVCKGNHWHHSKSEKFLVVAGEAVVRFRGIGSKEVFSYRVSAEKPEVVDIPTGYTHQIENVADSDLVTLMWASEPFDPERPDTYFEEV